MTSVIAAGGFFNVVLVIVLIACIAMMTVSGVAGMYIEMHSPVSAAAATMTA